MLEIRNLKKIYKTPGGEEVHALDGVSIQFPEKGLVFLLGKSGSGKSTMLNLLGGIDKPDEGEIIVDGCNSKDFSQSDFDSYRNTYVGIVFQEFNILNEFSIGTNISIALQLQNRHNDRASVEEILELVELGGMYDRKPETLSGGQKQRVAIARAIIKNPEIVLADEPTGALDSKTGEQIFTTLQKLSRNRLVVVVSHDRDSAEKYADRIIELADGRIINDVIKCPIEAEKVSENVDFIGDSTVKISDVDKVTTEELKTILGKIQGSNQEVILTYNENLDKVKKVCKINEKGGMDGFVKTPPEERRQEQTNKASFVKAKLPLWPAIKLGASSFKQNTVRFLLTILLSVVAFCVFGAVSTLVLYKPNYSFSRALQEMNYQSLMMDKYYERTEQYYDVNEDWSETVTRTVTSRQATLYGEQEIAELNKNGVGLNFAGVYMFKNANLIDGTEEFRVNKAFSNKYSNYATYYEYRGFKGFSDCGEQFMKDNGFKCYGRYPENAGEIAISNYMFELLRYCYGVPTFTQEEFLFEEFNLVIDPVNVTGVGQITVKVVGIYDISDYSKYDCVKDKSNDSVSGTQRTALLREFKEVLAQSMDLVGFVSPDFYTKYSEGLKVSTSLKPLNVSGFYISTTSQTDSEDEWVISETQVVKSQNFSTSEDLKNYPEKFRFFDLDGNEIPTSQVNLSDYGFYMSYSKYTSHLSFLNKYYGNNSNDKIQAALKNKMWAVTGTQGNVVTLKMELLGYFKMADGVSTSLGGDYVIKYDTLRQYAGKRVKETGLRREASKYQVPNDAKYNFVISMSDNTLEQVEYLLKDDGIVEYRIMNDAYDRIFGSEVIETMEKYERIFLIVGAVTTAFSALMLMNFITTSINAKRKEIGILRAVGAGKADIFKIFFTETFLLAIISFVLAAIGAGFVVSYVNKILYEITFTHLLQYEFINVILIFFISVFISFASTVFPVYKEAIKLPVNSIRQL